jgi:hypothetical protein
MSVVLFLGAVLSAQDSAEMAAPVIRSAEGKVVFSSRFQSFATGSSYRIGVGGVDVTPDAQLELLLDDEPLDFEPVSFQQGNTSHWWGMVELAAKGYILKPSDLPTEGQNLRMRITIPREIIDTYEKVYIFVSKDYGSDVWYLEDGIELEKSYW